jgi:thymidylate kinase
MYIAIEGIKGSGKSTLVEGLTTRLGARDLTFHVLAPTRPMSANEPLEQLLRRGGEGDDALVEAVYAARSTHHALAAESGRVDLVLGDRSLFTSLSTRWHQHDPHHPHDHISRVRSREPVLRFPDHVLYLQTPLEVAVGRTRLRPDRDYGRRDEQPERLRDAHEGYLATRTLCPRGPYGAYTAWHDVDATRPAEVVRQECERRILELLRTR